MAKLAGNALRYRRLRRSGSPWRLESLSLEITHRCFCRCRMCNIWQIPAEVPDLDLAFWRQVLCSPELHHLRELDLTGGEPFLRHDIGSLLATISELQATQFPKLRTLAITTNGILTDRILEQVGAVVNELGRRGIDLVLACGMDAVGGLHDRIRNHPGAWRSLERTLDGLARLRRSSPRLVLGIKTTVIPENVRYLESIAAYASERDLFTIISPRI
ncbi:MAG: radical SAM protein, partial [Desulfuromonadales bacterium]|nr:radical SAM protein [Desulfuromonadales bacterium]NIS41455.1 radical SAM protein [Desulfuromonadales bacterium]